MLEGLDCNVLVGWFIFGLVWSGLGGYRRTLCANGADVCVEFLFFRVW